MTTQAWQPGTLYSPGAVVKRNSAPAPVSSPPSNADFEAGDTGWTKEAPWAIGTYDNKFDGSYSARCTGTKGTFRIYDATAVIAVPGLTITASCQVRRADSGVKGQVQLEWLDSGMVSLRIDEGTLIDFSEDKWKESEVTGTAPANTAYVRVGAKGILGNTSTNLHVDGFKWNYAYLPPIDALVFQAVQAAPGYSGATEPTWPTVNGIQVVDNEVTWEAIDSSTVTWEASPILVSGTTEPIFPTEVGATVADNTIVWEAVSRRVEDEKCPNGTAVAIAGSKIFCGDDDIIAFSATVNPLDWSTTDDAGYLPFGLQAYGSKPVTALNLYRSNLVAFNGISFQMWQVDPDPQNMAFLDAVPVGCYYPETLQAFQNDLLFQSPVGIRNISIAGASTNLQAGPFGKPVDPLVREYMADPNIVPRSAFVPEYGQYWALYGSEALVLTLLGIKQVSWSRYTFNHVFEVATVHENALHVRSDEGVVLRFTADEVDDDVYCQPTPPTLTIEGDAVYLTAALTWTAAEFDGGVASYLVLRATDEGLFNVIATVAGDVLTYTDSGLLQDKLYSYRVVAVPSGDGINSEPSNDASVYFPSIESPVLSGVYSAGDNDLSWTAAVPSSGSITQYDVYRSVDGSAYALIATTDGVTLAYADVGVSLDTLYRYYVVATTSTALTATSNTIAITEASAPETGVFIPAGWMNPGAELGVAYWTANPVGMGYTTARSPPVESNAWWGGTNPVSKQYQDFSTASTGISNATVDAGTVELVVDWWGGTYEQYLENDQVRLNVVFFNGSMAQIGTGTSGTKDPTTVASGSYLWDQYQTVVAVPVGTRTIRIELEAIRLRGAYNDAGFDEVQPYLRTT